jgi:hypothetical protein
MDKMHVDLPYDTKGHPGTVAQHSAAGRFYHSTVSPLAPHGVSQTIKGWQANIGTVARCVVVYSGAYQTTVHSPAPRE